VPQTVTGMRDRIRILVRVGLGALLVWAAVAKLRDPHAFAQDIANYRILPASLVAPVAATLPGVEIVVGLALVLAAWRRAAAAAAFWLLVLFALAVGAALVRGINIECGCFGATGRPATWWTFARDLGLSAAALFVFATSPERPVAPLSSADPT